MRTNNRRLKHVLVILSSLATTAMATTAMDCAQASDASTAQDVAIAAAQARIADTKDRVGAEAVDILSRYIQVNTTNPPGNEQAGAEFLAAILRKDGISAEVIATSPGRACVYARLKGSQRKRPLILLNHIDVVPAQGADWTYPPFSGEVHDGELWGRGALDMKGMAVAELVSMLEIKRSGVTLDRDLIFLGTPDEETGGDSGAKWIKEHRPDLVKDAEFLLNEGCDIQADSAGKAQYWGVDVAEKNPLWLKLVAKGEAGHASMPLADSAPNRLVRALHRLISAKPDIVVSPVVREFFSSISSIQPPQLQSAFRNIDKAVEDPKIWQLVAQDRQKSAMLMNTVSLTVINAGYKTNVIPAEATAELDCRLLPETKEQDFIAYIKRLLVDSTIDVQVLDWQHADASPRNTELFSAIKEVAAEESATIPVVPVVVGWFTDSHWFRELGIVSYGFEPFEIDAAHLATVHGKNERVPVAALTAAVHRMQKIILKLAASTK